MNVPLLDQLDWLKLLESRKEKAPTEDAQQGGSREEKELEKAKKMGDPEMIEAAALKLGEARAKKELEQVRMEAEGTLKFHKALVERLEKEVATLKDQLAEQLKLAKARAKEMAAAREAAFIASPAAAEPKAEKGKGAGGRAGTPAKGKKGAPKAKTSRTPAKPTGRMDSQSAVA